MQMPEIAERANRLLQFLRAMQEMRTRPIRTFNEYPRIFWLAEVPTGDRRCGAAWTADVEAREGIWLSLERVDRLPPPQLPDGLAPWVAPADLLDSSLDRPQLLDGTELPVEVVELGGDRRAGAEYASLEDHAYIRAAYADWLPGWQDWATRDQSRRERGDGIMPVAATLGASRHRARRRQPRSSRPR